MCGGMQVWDVTEGKQLLVLKGHTDALLSATWSPDGRHVLTGGSDGKLILWDAISGENKKVSPPMHGKEKPQFNT